MNKLITILILGLIFLSVNAHLRGSNLEDSNNLEDSMNVDLWIVQPIASDVPVRSTGVPLGNWPQEFGNSFKNHRIADMTTDESLELLKWKHVGSKRSRNVDGKRANTIIDIIAHHAMDEAIQLSAFKDLARFINQATGLDKRIRDIFEHHVADAAEDVEFLKWKDIGKAAKNVGKFEEKHMKTIIP